MSEEDKTLKEYVESKIEKWTFKAKDFSIEELNVVDEYCKQNYGNNRKLMIMDLIRYKDENVAIFLLNDKINYLYEEVQSLKGTENKVEEKKKYEWKGFSNTVKR